MIKPGTGFMGKLYDLGAVRISEASLGCTSTRVGIASTDVFSHVRIVLDSMSIPHWKCQSEVQYIDYS